MSARQFAPRSAPSAAPGQSIAYSVPGTMMAGLMPGSHGQPSMAGGMQTFAPQAAQPAHATSGHAGAGETDDAPEKSQRCIKYINVKFDQLRVKPKTRNPDRQKQNFPIRYVDSKSKDGFNLMEMNVSFLLGALEQQNVNSIISPAKAYQRDLGMPPENPHALSIGIRFTDPEIVEWIQNLNHSILQQLKDTGVTAQDAARPDIPVDELENHWKPPFVASEDGSYVGYFSFTDDSLRIKQSSARPMKMPVFERFTYHFDDERNPVVTHKEPIHYSEIVPYEDYCIVQFSLGAMRLDSMTMGNKGTRYPFIGSKLYLDRLFVLKYDQQEEEEVEDTIGMLSSTGNVKNMIPEHQSKRSRSE